MAAGLLQHMLHTSRTLIYHFQVEVVQRRWDELIRALAAGPDTFESLLATHEAFLQGCFREALLLDKRFKHSVWNLNMFFIFYADNTRDFLINSVTFDYRSLVVR